MRIVLLSLVALALIGCDTKRESTPAVRVFAAASLAEVLSELEPGIREKFGIEIQINAAGSGTLARQILAGAPADVFISADPRWMDELQEAGGIEPSSRRDLLRNRLVLIAGQGVADVPASLGDLSSFDGRLAIGEPESVPAGQYAKQALERAGAWTEMQDRLLPAVDVRAALAYVSAGEADLGIVYASDAAAARNVRIILTIEPDLHDPIVYPAAVVKDADNAEAAERVLDFLADEAARRIFQNAGFKVAP